MALRDKSGIVYTPNSVLRLPVEVHRSLKNITCAFFFELPPKIELLHIEFFEQINGKTLNGKTYMSRTLNPLEMIKPNYIEIYEGQPFDIESMKEFNRI